MRYFDVIKEGFRTANRNLAVLLTQFMAGLIMLFVFFLLAVILVFMALGSIPKLGLQTLSVDNLSALLQTSFTLIAVGVLFAVLFALLAGFYHRIRAFREPRLHNPDCAERGQRFHREGVLHHRRPLGMGDAWAVHNMGAYRPFHAVRLCPPLPPSVTRRCLAR